MRVRAIWAGRAGARYWSRADARVSRRCHARPGQAGDKPRSSPVAAVAAVAATERAASDAFDTTFSSSATYSRNRFRPVRVSRQFVCGRLLLVDFSMSTRRSEEHTSELQ